MKNEYYITLMVRDKGIPGAVLHITYKLKESSIKEAVLASKCIESKITDKFKYLPHSQYTNTKPFTGYSKQDYPSVDFPKLGDFTVFLNQSGEPQKHLKITLGKV